MSNKKAPNTSASERKRKNSADLGSANKHLKNNYYFVLSKEECNEEIVNKFAKRVEQCGNDQREPTNKKNINSEPNNVNDEFINKPTTNNENKNKKIPPLNIHNIDADELIEFIKMDSK